MDQSTRNKLRGAVAAMRVALEQDVKEQLEGIYAISPAGVFEPVGDVATLRTDPLRRQEREDIEAAIVHESEQIAGVRNPQQRLAEAVTRFARQVAFTWLNRLAAIKLMEARGLLRASVSDGPRSAGFREFQLIAPALARAYPDGGYRRYLELLCDDIATEIGVLFDRSLPWSRIFPSSRALDAVLEQLNQSELTGVWTEDETIGWIYQYFTPIEQRRQARKESAAPRNSYELAFLNQFFTPHYVVQFLTDNTLGRIWYEMQRGETALVEQCEYLVRRKRPVFLPDGGYPPAPFQPFEDFQVPDSGGEMWTRPNPEREDINAVFQYALTVDGYRYAREQFNVECADLTNEHRQRYHETKSWDGTFAELRCCLFYEQRSWRHSGEILEGADLAIIQALHQAIIKRWDLETEYIVHRPKKDPREIRVLDPACGSCHFLLYAFDLLETIYQEAYDDPELGPDLWLDYPDRNDFLRAVPGLILHFNLYGIDIDLRASQIGELALYLRAKRANPGAEVRHTNIVCAAPMPGDSGLLDEFLGQLGSPTLERMARAVWDAMQGADEIGSLLKIEQRVREVVEAERRQELRQRGVTAQPRQVAFTAEYERPRQPGFDLDYSDASEPNFWFNAERSILTLLGEFAGGLSGSGQMARRLFSRESIQGFEFIELMQHRYDVVLMNPPFGAPSSGAKGYIERCYPMSKHDLLAAFVERGVDILLPHGLVGAITSRACFFLASYESWRTNFILTTAPPRVVADLGVGIMDVAMVQAAAYCLQRQRSSTELSLPPLSAQSSSVEASIFINAVEVDDKPATLRSAVMAVGSGGWHHESLHTVNPHMFLTIPGSPFSYWVDDQVMRHFVAQEPFESKDRHATKGLATTDDFRFIRASWEIAAKTVIGRYASTSVELDNLDLNAQYRSISRFPGKSWATFVKGGARATYYADPHLCILWECDGEEMKSFLDSKIGRAGQWSRWINSTDHYFRPGVTWTARSQAGFSVRAMPAGCIFGDKGPSAFQNSNETVELMALVAVMNTAVFRSMIELLTSFGSYGVGVVQRIPLPSTFQDCKKELSELALRAYELSREAMLNEENSHVFGVPRLIMGKASSLKLAATSVQHTLERQRVELNVISERIDKLGYEIYGTGAGTTDQWPATNQGNNIDEDDEGEQDDYLVSVSISDWTAELLSWSIGVSLGRWDVRFALDQSLLPKLQDPFEPLPICPPGMLVGPHGLPATREGIVNEQWLRARPDAITLPLVDSVVRSAMGVDEYPLSVAWDGILVDDVGHDADIIMRSRQALALIFGERADAIEREACELLGVASIRDWFRNPKYFWERHISHYSKSRRKAPIYWLLQSDRKSYSVWLYLHRLTSDTLHRVRNDFVTPKIDLEVRRLAEFNAAHAAADAFGDNREARRLAKERDTQEKLVEELHRFRTELQRVIDLGYDPDLDDGVVLNIAPLHKLVPWKEAGRYWKELVEGKYEWSTMSKRLHAAGEVRT